MLDTMESVTGISSHSTLILRAVSVRDWEALRRDGEPVFAVRQLDTDTVEVLFGDGMWMLAAQEDVSPNTV
jgi:hypothetical protein